MPARVTDAAIARELSIVPANEASWDDLRAVFGSRGEAYICQCQRYKLEPKEAFSKVPVEERGHRLRTQTECGHPRSQTTSGLVAYLDHEPVGWCAVEPRVAYFGLMRNFKIHWQGRSEDKADDTVWSVTCFVVRAGYRRRGISYALARAAVDFARERGARALEGYPMLVQPGQDVTWGELHVGSRSIFEAAGFAEVSRPSKRRVVMRVDFSS
jgi:GNAT superfamily N-acetyltransferase